MTDSQFNALTRQLGEIQEDVRVLKGKMDTLASLLTGRPGQKVDWNQLRRAVFPTVD